MGILRDIGAPGLIIIVLGALLIFTRAWTVNRKNVFRV